MIYELVTIRCLPLQLEAVSAAARKESAGELRARLLGAWRSEIGELFQLKLLRAYDTLDAYENAHEQALHSPTPYGVDNASVSVRSERYKAFPFLPDVRPAQRGQFYEFRTYHLKPGGLSPTLAGWEKAITPAKALTEHLLIAMYALDGPPRITHIWEFASLEQRGVLRAEHFRNGTWPPEGAREQIQQAASTIYIAESGSLVC
jgi:hypothetical protein